MSMKNPVRMMLALTLLASSTLVAGCFSNGGDADHYQAEPEQTAEAESAIDIKVEPVMPEEEDAGEGPAADATA